MVLVKFVDDATWVGGKASNVSDGFNLFSKVGESKTKVDSETDPYARQGQKKQGREKKEVKKQKDNWDINPNKRQKPLPKHTPGKDHRKY